jgi:non-specific serine/threonine protein kinase
MPDVRIEAPVYLRVAHSALGEAAYDSAWAEGQAMTVDQAVGDAPYGHDSVTAGNALQLPTTASRAPTPLSPRELEVVLLLAQGMSNLQIAEALILSERTVESHVRSCMGKLHINSRVRLANWATRELSAGTEAVIGKQMQ